MKLAMTPPLVSSPNDAVAVADEIAQPAHDLLLDERRDGPGVPDVDALVGTWASSSPMIDIGSGGGVK